MKVESIEEFLNVATVFFVKRRSRATFSFRSRPSKRDLVCRITDKAQTFTFATKNFDDLRQLNVLGGMIMQICADDSIGESDLENLRVSVRERMQTLHRIKEQQKRQALKQQQQSKKKGGKKGKKGKR